MPKMGARAAARRCRPSGPRRASARPAWSASRAHGCRRTPRAGTRCRPQRSPRGCAGRRRACRGRAAPGPRAPRPRSRCRCHSPEPRDRRLVDVTLADGRERARRDGDAAHEGCGEVRDRSGHDEDEDVLVHLPTFARTPTLASGLTQRGYAGKRVTRSVTSARTCLLTAWSGSASPLVTALWMSAAICFISSRPIPWVVTDGVPTRMPRGDVGLLRVERDGVLVEHDARGVGPLLGLLAGDADALEVEQRQVGVGAAGRRTDADPRAGSPRAAGCWR